MSALMRRCLLASFLALLPAAEAVAQRPDDGSTLPRGTSVAHEPWDRLPESLRWQLSLAQAAFRVSDTRFNRSDLVTALEGAVQILCMRDLPATLQYAGAPEDTECKEAIGDLIALDDENPVAICAQRGIDAPECSHAYDRQATSSMLADGSALPPNKLDSVIESKKSAPEYDAMRPELNLAVQNAGGSRSPELVNKAKDLYRKAFALVCKNPRIVLLEKRRAPDDLPTPISNGGKSPSFEELLRSAKTAEQLKRQSLPPTRTRLVPQPCHALIVEALNFDPQFDSALCVRDGIYSPACIHARRAGRKKSTPSAGGSNTQTGGKGERFEEF